MGFAYQGPFSSIIFLLYSWGSLFGVPIRTLSRLGCGALVGLYGVIWRVMWELYRGYMGRYAGFLGFGFKVEGLGFEF